MHNTKIIRDNPDAFDQAMKRRGLDPAAEEICIIDGERRRYLTEIQSMQETRNKVSRHIGEVKQAGGDISGLSRQVAELKSTLAGLEKKIKDADERLTELLLKYPNILDDRVPDGDDENDNEIIRYDGEIKTLAFPAKDHVALGEGLGMMDFSTAAKLSGSRFCHSQKHIGAPRACDCCFYARCSHERIWLYGIPAAIPCQKRCYARHGSTAKIR